LRRSSPSCSDLQALNPAHAALASAPAIAYALAMRTSLLTLTALSLALLSGEAGARVYEAKQLAKYDLSYQKCESQYPDMRGHGDEAYLNLWRIKPDDKALAQLAKVRSSAAYQTEKQHLGHAAPKSASAAASISRECQGLWGEFQRNGKPTK
jgi:hypothetical protein